MSSSAVLALHDPLIAGGVLSETRAAELSRNLQEFLARLSARRVSDHEYWAAFQQEFGFAHAQAKVTPMNAANLCPEPTALLESANALRLAYNVNVAQQVRMAHGERVTQMRVARSLLAGGLGLPEETTDLVMVRNASEGNNAINCGFRDWNRDRKDNVVLWEWNHPTNLSAWQMRSEWDDPHARLFEVRIVELGDVDKLDATLIAKHFTDKINDRTRFVSFSAISNISGIRIPEAAIELIWNKVKDLPHCHLHVDATMAWGALNLGRGGFCLQKYCHSFVSSAHKWFLGPKETGILYMDPKKTKNFEPSIFGYNYEIVFNELEATKANHALRFEQLGQRDDVQLITLAYTQLMWDAIRESGHDPYTRVRTLADHLITQLTTSKPGWRFVTPTCKDLRWGIVWVHAPWQPADEQQDQTPGLPTTSLYEWLYKEKAIAGSSHGEKRSETFRLCPHIYNTIEDVERAVKGMNEWRAGMVA